jgi:hypothetical protein
MTRTLPPDKKRRGRHYDPSESIPRTDYIVPLHMPDYIIAHRVVRRLTARGIYNHFFISTSSADVVLRDTFVFSHTTALCVIVIFVCVSSNKN